MALGGVHQIPSDNTSSPDNTNSLKGHPSSTVPAKEKLPELKQAIPVPVREPASGAKMKNHSLDQLTKHSPLQLLSELNERKKGVEELFNAALPVSQHKPVLTEELIGKISSQVVGQIIRDGLAAQATSVEDMDLSQTMQPFLIEEGFIKEVQVPELDLAVVGANILSRGSVIFTSGMLLNKIEEAIEAKEHYLTSCFNEEEKESIQQEIIILKKWVKVRLSIMSSSMQDLTFNVAMSSPTALSAIVVVAKATGTVVSSIIDWVGLGIGFVGSVLSFHFSRMNFKTHDTWAALIGIKGEGETVDDLTLRKTNVDEIVKSQKKIFAKRFASNHPELCKRLLTVVPDLDIASFSNEDWKPNDETLDKLVAADIDLSEIKEAVNDLKKKEMLSVSLKKGLLAFNQKKDSIDKGFLQYEVNKSGGLLTLASLLTGTVIVLKALLIAGVIVSTVALTALGYGMLGVVIGTMIFGAVYLYLKKPNIFKTYLKGVQFQLFFWSIPKAIQNFRSHYAQLDEMKVTYQINDIRGRVFEAERLLNGEKKDIESFLNRHLPEKKTSELDVNNILRKYIKKLKKTEAVKEKEVAQINEKISGLNESIADLEAKLKPLQEQVDAAGWKDFQRSLERERGETPVAELGDDASILAEHLIQDIDLEEDSETRKLLLHMDINPNTLSKEDAKFLKEMVAERIRAFFAMETSETMGMINKQNLLERHGLRENIADS